jgi:hypothetical protein
MFSIFHLSKRFVPIALSSSTSASFRQNEKSGHNNVFPISGPNHRSRQKWGRSIHYFFKSSFETILSATSAIHLSPHHIPHIRFDNCNPSYTAISSSIVTRCNCSHDFPQETTRTTGRSVHSFNDTFGIRGTTQLSGHLTHL